MNSGLTLYIRFTASCFTTSVCDSDEADPSSCCKHREISDNNVEYMSV